MTALVFGLIISLGGLAPQIVASGSVRIEGGVTMMQTAASFVDQTLTCNGTAWPTAAPWAATSAPSPDDMASGDNQVGTTTCRDWGPPPAQDVLTAGRPVRGATE